MKVKDGNPPNQEYVIVWMEVHQIVARRIHFLPSRVYTYVFRARE